MAKPDVKIICVLKRSNVYDVDYVERLKEQVDTYVPGADLYCISNVPVPCKRIPIKKMWPGWWSKMELFHPDIKGDLFFLDLDTIICGNIDDLLGVGKLTMLTDFYKPMGYGSGLMYLPEGVRGKVWEHFNKNTLGWMQQFRRGGDQDYLHMCFGNIPLRWQDEFPNRVISYKAHRVAKQGVPEGTGIVCFHGRPKNRDVNWQLPGFEYVRGQYVPIGEN
jgi:hypothetical protein